MERRSVVPGIVVGGATLTLVGAIAALIASTPAEAASDSEKLDYLIQASNTQTGIISALTQQITDLNETLKAIREINGVDFAFDPMRYIAWKLRSGEAYPDRGSYYQLLGPAGVFIANFIMPEGYVWIGIWEGVVVSQNGVFESNRMVDGAVLPWMWVPRVASGEFHWAQSHPFGFVIKNISVVTITNHDAFNQWFIGGYFGMYLRADVWERDSKIIDQVAEKYSTPPEVYVG